MATCHICLDDLKNPVALPCGHLFCGGCIFKAIQSVQPYSHLHACPLCRTLYNITPVNMQVVPPNLRPFVTPSIRKVYLNTPEPSATPEQQGDAPCTSSACAAAASSVSSETQATISRLEAENHALRTSCAMWRRRAELHGSANLGLLNFAKMVRDQATLLVREREQLKEYCQSLKHKLDVYESNQQSVEQLLQALHEASMRPALEPESSYSPQERCIKLLPSRARSRAQQPVQRTPSSAPPQPAPSASYGYDEHCRKRAKLARDQPASGSSMDSLLGTAGRAIFLPQTGQEPSLHTESA